MASMDVDDIYTSSFALDMSAWAFIRGNCAYAIFTKMPVFSPKMYKFLVEKYKFSIFAYEFFKVKLKNCK